MPTYEGAVDVSASVPSSIHLSPATLGDRASCITTDPGCSTHVAKDDMAVHVPSCNHPSPAASRDTASCILTDTVCSTRVAENDVTAACIQTQ